MNLVIRESPARIDRTGNSLNRATPVKGAQPSYVKVGREFVGHGTVNHSIQEYVRGGFWHTNTVENYFSILKRGITGVYQHVSQQHLKRYLGEFDFRYNEREGLGVTDDDRAAKALKGITGKRLTYRRTNEAQA